jgi:hypothetical protein
MAGTLGIAAVSCSAGIVGSAPASKYFLLFALMMLLVAALGATMRYRRVRLADVVRTVMRDGMGATEIRYSTWQFRILIALMACGTVLPVLAAGEMFTRQLQSGPSGATVLLGTVGLFFASFLVAVALGRLHPGRIELSGRGIAQCGWSFESRLPWSAVAGVKPACNGYPAVLVIGYTNADWQRRHTTRLWRIDRLPPVPMIEVDCRKFDVDPQALYDYVRTYVDEPSARGELGTQAALSRAAAR